MILNEILIRDTGWINVDLSSSAFRLYGSGDVCQYRKIGKTVFLRGTIQPKNQIQSDQNTTIYTLPSGFYNTDRSICTVCQGSGMNRWVLTVEANGRVTCSRYGTTTNSAIANNVWLPFYLVFTLNN